MPVSLDQCGSLSTLRLEGDIGIDAAVELKRVLMEALVSAKELRVEITAAATLDITIFQLLWVAQRAAAKAGVSFSISGPLPQEIALAMDHAGLERLPVTQG